MIEDTKKKDTEDVGGAGDLLATLESDQVTDTLPTAIETAESDQPRRTVSCLLLLILFFIIQLIRKILLSSLFSFSLF